MPYADPNQHADAVREGMRRRYAEIKADPDAYEEHYRRHRERESRPEQKAKRAARRRELRRLAKLQDQLSSLKGEPETPSKGQ